MDEAFKPFAETIVELVDQRPVVGTEDGQKIVMTGIEVELPVELDVSRHPSAGLRIGSTPPLYPLLTSVPPSFHQMRVRATLSQESQDG